MRKLIIAVSALALTGCSAFPSAMQSVKLTCAQPGTIVMVNGVRKDCPSTVDLPRNRDFTVEAHKAGLSPMSRTISYHFGPLGKWDVVGTAVWGIPVIGLLFPGAWDLDQTDINVDLFPI